MPPTCAAAAQAGATFVAPVDGRAHVSGERSEPLLQQTIPALLVGHRQQIRHARCRRLRRPGQALHLERTCRNGGRARRRLPGARPGKRRPRRHLVAEPLGMAGDAVRHRPHRPDPGQHQPRLPADRTRLCAEQGRLPSAGHGRQIQELRLSRHDRDAGAGDRDRRRRANSMRKNCRRSKIVIRMGEEHSPGMLNFTDVLAMAGARRA